MTPLDKFIASLSPEERERHKDLIAKCKKRELQIKDATLRSYLALLKNRNEPPLLAGLQAADAKGAEVLDSISSVSLALHNMAFNMYCSRKKEAG